MVHCPECESSLTTTDDIEFAEMDATIGFLKASKRFYTANCGTCGATLGSGVAAKSADGAAAAGAGGA